MSDDQRVREYLIVCSYCAATSSDDSLRRLLPHCDEQEIAAIKLALNQLQASKLIRVVARLNQRFQQQGTTVPPSVTFDDGAVSIDGIQAGKLLQLYKTFQPFEAQARIAYEVFFARFFDYLATRYKVVVLQENEATVELFLPTTIGFDLETAWIEGVAHVFSENNLRSGFIALVNSVKLTSKGFSALLTPIIAREQANVLAAFNLANILILKSAEHKQEQEINKTVARLQTAKATQQARLKATLLNQEAALENTRTKNSEFFAALEDIELVYPDWFRYVAALCKREFRPLAGTQIAKDPAKLRIALKQIRELGQRVHEHRYDRLSILLHPIEPQPSAHTAGDNNKRICYGCGKPLSKSENGFTARSFIFSSPSQRLQSGGSQEQPPICSVCAALSFISPIKLGGGRLVLRLRQREANFSARANYMVEEQLRMFCLGGLNIVAGKCVLLPSNEKMGKDKVIDKLGTVQYAIYQTGSLFPVEVFEQCTPEVIVNETVVTIQSRHVAWMHYLNDVFWLNRSWGKEKDAKPKFASLGRAIRHIQQDNIIFAIYELMTGGLVDDPLRLRGTNAVYLEQLRYQHVRWLDMPTEKQQFKAEFYRDVAGMTGLLYAFCSFVYSKFTGNEQRIEVRKLIERLDDPNHFIYTTAGNTERESATLSRQEDMYFSYDQAKRILQSIGVDVEQREQLSEKGRTQLRINFDDVVAAYTWLFESKYVKLTEQRDFLYALKLSLHARFPELIERQKEHE